MLKKNLLIAILSLFLFGMAAQTVAGPPEVMVFAVHKVGTGGHRLVSLAAEGIIEQTGTKVRCVPAGADVARAMMAREGEAQIAALNSLGGWTLQEGLLDYSSPDWGPQPVRYLYTPEHAGITTAVKGGQKIYKLSDLRGKKVPSFPGSPALQMMTHAQLAFGGLTWDDVDVVPFASPVAAQKAVIKGRLDACIFNVAGGTTHQLAALPGGMRYLEVPADDAEGWKRLQKIAPMLAPKQAAIGATLSEDKPAWVMGQGYPNFIAWATLDSETAYYITRYLHESYGKYATKHKSLKRDWKIEIVISRFDLDIAPMHDGAVRYFKEQGLWTAEREKINQKRLAHQEKLQELWSETLKEAKAKKLKEDKFKELWLNKRAAAGFWVQGK